jgi:hypothetical protein
MKDTTVYIVNALRDTVYRADNTRVNMNGLGYPYMGFRSFKHAQDFLFRHKRLQISDVSRELQKLECDLDIISKLTESEITEFDRSKA